jgi:hypothetical protein
VLCHVMVLSIFVCSAFFYLYAVHCVSFCSRDIVCVFGFVVGCVRVCVVP